MSALELITGLTQLNGCSPSPRSSSPCSSSQPLLGCVIPSGELLERLLSVLVIFPRGRLGEGALGGPGNGGRSDRRESRADSADLRRRAHEGHVACQLAAGKLGRGFWRGRVVGSRAVRRWAVVLVVRVLVRL
jgi:hypothetical protein